MEGIREPLWGQWYLGERLYAGAETEVYALTRRGGMGRPCAVKCIRVPAGREEELERVESECRTQERMADSGGAVAILDDMVVPVEGPDGSVSHYEILLRMERLECLADLLREGMQFSEAEVRKLARDLCEALIFAHRLNVVHRDIKPANIYRSPSGQFKLGDFGIAARTDGQAIGTLAGTAAYMAPEAAAGRNSGAQADLYSLGIVLYQLLNDNFLPMTHDGSTYAEVQNTISARLRGTRVPRVPCRTSRLRRAVARACAPDPRRRWHSAEEMLAALNGPSGPALLKTVSACVLSLSVGFGAAGFLAARVGRTGKAAGPSPAASVPVAVTERTETESGGGMEKNVVHRYEVINQKLDWDSAMVWCESRGGHLATITSAEESKQVIALLEKAGMQAVWLGADNRNAANGFRWITDEPFVYAEWGAGEPNNYGGAEYYLMLLHKDGQGWIWNDSRVDGLKSFSPNSCGFVCEWEGDSP